MKLTQAEIVATLSGSALFRNLPPGARVAIADIAQSQSFAAGEVIIKEGDEVPGLSLILTGRVMVKTLSPKGEPLALKTLGDGSWFGEVGFLKDRPATATVEARTEVSTLLLPTEALKPLLEPHPQIRAILEQLTLLRAEDTIKKTILSMD